MKGKKKGNAIIEKGAREGEKKMARFESSNAEPSSDKENLPQSTTGNKVNSSFRNFKYKANGV
jgi:hypothetical protein